MSCGACKIKRMQGRTTLEMFGEDGLCDATLLLSGSNSLKLSIREVIMTIQILQAAPLSNEWLNVKKIIYLLSTEMAGNDLANREREYEPFQTTWLWLCTLLASTPLPQMAPHHGCRCWLMLFRDSRTTLRQPVGLPANPPASHAHRRSTFPFQVRDMPCTVQ